MDKNNSMLLVYDDIIYSLQKSGGGSVYWTEVIRPTLEQATHYVYDSADSNIFYRQISIKHENRLSSKGLKFKRFLNPKFNSDFPFIFHSSYFRYCKNKKAINITTVHDFTTEKYIGGIHRIVHSFQLRRAIKHSKGVICVSDSTKRDFLSFFPWYNGKIETILNGYDKSSYYVEPNVIKTKDVVFVGARSSYKRFDIAIEIVNQLSLCRLVIIGGGELSKKEKKALDDRIPGRYEKRGFVSNEELRHLYCSAFFLCYPSEYEGFGIPLLEAQACGCPVVCQKKTSIPEVVAESAVFVDGDCLDKGIDQIKCLFNNDTYEEYRRRGLENVKRFSWEKCATEHQVYYKKIWDMYVKDSNSIGDM